MIDATTAGQIRLDNKLITIEKLPTEQLEDYLVQVQNRDAELTKENYQIITNLINNQIS